MAQSVLVTRPIPQAGIERLRQAGLEVEVSPHDRALSAEELRAAVRGKAGVLSMLSDQINLGLLEAAGTLKGVSNYAVGYNNIDVPACTARGIGVANTPGVLTDATAEIAFALLLACARRIVESDAHVRTGRWDGWGPMQFVGTGVVGKTLGIVGPGRIAERVAKMARGFDMPILYYSRREHPEWDRAFGARRCTLEELLAESDFVSLHTPLTPETRHLIGAAQLAKMKPTAVLINTARGPIVDEAALVGALRERRIFAAGFDVYEHEPRLTPGLIDLPNVVCLPHIGSGTTETRQRMAVIAADNLIAMVRGQKPAHPVNGELWELKVDLHADKGHEERGRGAAVTPHAG